MGRPGLGLGLGLWDIPQVRILLLGSSDPGSPLWSLRKLPDIHQLIIRLLEPDWREEVLPAAECLVPICGGRRTRSTCTRLLDEAAYRTNRSHWYSGSPPNDSVARKNR